MGTWLFVVKLLVLRVRSLQRHPAVKPVPDTPDSGARPVPVPALPGEAASGDQCHGG
jgi:hypothetical protein